MEHDTSPTASAGRRCIVLVPRESDVPVVDAASRHLWGKILRGGVEVHRYGAEVLHEKTLVFDRVLTVIGSSADGVDDMYSSQ